MHVSSFLHNHDEFVGVFLQSLQVQQQVECYPFEECNRMCKDSESSGPLWVPTLFSKAEIDIQIYVAHF